MLRTTCIVAGALLTLPLAARAQAPETIEVVGRVIDEDSGAPVPQVMVHVAGTSIGSLTDSEGRYRLEGVPNENSVVSAQRLGYVPEMRALWVCSPLIHPDGSCRATSSVEVREVRFFMRGAPPLQAR